MAKLRLILGDQLNHQHSWYKYKDDSCIYLMMEMRQETDYVKHHIQKLSAFFAAMRRFADHLRTNGHRVIYLKINDPDNHQQLEENIDAVIQRLAFEGERISEFQYQEPDEYRLDEQLTNVSQSLNMEVSACTSEHFLTERSELAEFFKGKKQYLMESFYRSMRKKHDILMDGEEPEGSKWNYDKSNRQAYNGRVSIPSSYHAHNDVKVEFEDILKSGAEFIGEIEIDDLPWPLDRNQALAALKYFCKNQLQYFGTYQDAMFTTSKDLFHSRLSFAMNVKLLNPLEVIGEVIKARDDNPDKIQISQVEGFIRQILGWREYMRGIYWAQMPHYSKLNYFGFERELPEWFWTGNTKMNCLSQTINSSLENAYAHHIQRLMITGNFALLAGIDPDYVDEWYLGIYIDAIEWVEITNTRGMSQFADGGIVGTKPYVSSSNYINKMSNYCDDCTYSHKKRSGDNSCPFNSLYWKFYADHRRLLIKNPRIGMMYRTWDRMNEDKKKEIQNTAETYLSNLQTL